jgi:hypothetical protein
MHKNLPENLKGRDHVGNLGTDGNTKMDLKGRERECGQGPVAVQCKQQ